MNICFYLFCCPGWGGLSKGMSGCIPAQWICRARLSYRIPVWVQREVRPKKASVCWYSAMQICAVACAHTSALIHSSRLGLSSRTLVCYSKLWPCRRNAVSLGWFLLALVKFVHGRNWAKSPKITVHLCIDGQFQGSAETQHIKPSYQGLGATTPSVKTPKIDSALLLIVSSADWFCFISWLHRFLVLPNSGPSRQSQDVLLTFRLCPFLKWELRVAIMTAMARKALIRNGPDEECAEGLM